MTNRKKRLIYFALGVIIIASFIVNFIGYYDRIFSFFKLDGRYDYNFVTFLDIGQGDCTLIHSNGKFVLVDSGYNNDDGIAVLNKLRSYNVRRLEYIIVSHDHSDHAGGIYKILDELEVGAIICSDGAFRDTEETLTKNVLYAADESGTNLVTAAVGDKLQVGDACFEFLWLDERINENDRCLVFMLTMNNRKFFFGGDITKAVEKRMINAGVSVSCDVLKASHHGSSTGTCDEFLDAASPLYCVVCCGEDNRYGLPSEEFVDRVTARDIVLFTTADHGDITFSTDNNVLSVKK